LTGNPGHSLSEFAITFISLGKAKIATATRKNDMKIVGIKPILVI